MKKPQSSLGCERRRLQMLVRMARRIRQGRRVWMIRTPDGWQIL